MSGERGSPGDFLRRVGLTAGRVRGEVDAEFAFHLEQRVQELIAAGLAPEQARQEALRRFGDLERARDVCVRADLSVVGRRRRRDFTEELRVDARHALRQLVRRPALAALAIGTLALGIGATTALFSAADHVLLRPLPYAAAEDVVAVWKRDARTGATRLGVAPGDFADYEARATRFSAWGLAEPFSYDEIGGERPEPLSAWHVTAGFFDALGVRGAALGRLFTAEEYATAGPPQAPGGVVVLDHGYWQRRFGGDPGVIGTMLELEGPARTIVGVLPPGVEYPERRAIWAPKRLTEAEQRERRTSHMFAVARLAQATTLEAARAELDAISAQLAAENPATNAASTAVLVPLNEQVLGAVRPALLVLLAAVGVVLLIACANVSGLLLARNVERARELAVRAALGAGRRRLARQLLVESGTLALAGGLAGIAVAWAALRLFHATAPAALPRAESVSLDARVLLFAVAATLLTALLCGLLPALGAARASPGATLRGGGRGATRGRRSDRAQRVLVTAEVALAFVLVVGAGLLARSFVTLLGNDPGFAVEQRVLLQAHLWARNPSLEQRIARAEAIEARLAALPDVIAAGITTAAPFHPSRMDPLSSLEVVGQATVRPEEERRVVTILASPTYFDAMGMRLVRGRGFEPRDRLGAPDVVVLNEAAARLLFAGEDPLGRRVRVGVFGAPREREVVGVVRDTRPAGFESEPQPEAYVPFAQHGFGSVTWVVHVRGDAHAALPLLHEAFWEVDPGQSIYQAAAIETIVADTLLSRRFQLLVLGALSALAIALAAIGIYALIAFWTQGRRREISVRMALGARGADIVGMIVGDALRLSGPGLLIGGVAALALTRFMRGMLYGVPPTDPLTFAPLALLMLAVAVAAAAGPALRAARGQPVTALRGE